MIRPLRGLRTAGSVTWATLNEFMRDGCPALAAALAYYAIFSLPPLLVLLLVTIGTAVDPETVRELLTGQVGALLGPRGAEQVLQLLRNASRPEMGGTAAILGLLALLFGATTAFAHLQNALNTAWGVAPNPRRGDVLNFLLKRLISLAMVLGIAFFLLISLVIGAVIAAVGNLLSAFAPQWLSQQFLAVIDISLSLTIATLLFAALFQYLPDAVVRWRHALAGGFLTGILFSVGKAAIGLYIGRTDPGSVYGAAGSLVVILLWLYYTAVILFLGAEFTEVWATRRGHPIIPERGAVRVIKREEKLEHGEVA